MACITGHRFAPAKEIRIDRLDHLDHPAGGALHSGVVGVFFPISQDLITVAVRAVVA